ncbi:phospholipid scramblase 2-like [Dreissena polymorpha]|uniref:phospholipid scramblase 2-like n=1 Tax=Dreissena polymorpha TaxID=45954 RepID=UPI002264D7CF|nr:phospholipid scramblase 2-like [Dreissena polymorpha]
MSKVGQTPTGQQVIIGQPGVHGMPMGQPAPVAWMPKPAKIPGCPQGLEYLTQIDQILVKQKVDLFEMVVGWEQENKYKLLNSVGQQVYSAKEESGVCERQCCQSNRGFTMHITDNADVEVIKLERKFRCWKNSCWCACCECCAHLIKVEAPVGTTVGYVQQKCSPCPPRFSLLDDDKDEVLSIEGPCCIIPCANVEFKVISPKTGAEVGKVTKQWSGMAKELFTNADNFGISFPMDLDVKMKATMLGACFLIDFMYFEKDSNDNSLL